MTRDEERLWLAQRNGGEVEPLERHYHAGRITADSTVAHEYSYLDATGEVSFRKIKYEPKAFSYQSKLNGIWKNQRPEAWLLYRLPELLASDSKEAVHIAEGEKDADTLAAQSLIATAAPQEWSPAFNEHFADRVVFIIEDNDATGRRKAHKVARALRDIAAEVRIVSFPELDEGGDVTNFFEAGGTKEEFLARCASAPDFRDQAILMLEGQLSETVTKAQAGLIKAGVNIFQRGGDLVRLVRVDQPPDDDAHVKRPTGTTIIAAVREAFLHEQLAKYMEWARLDGKDKSRIVSDPKPKYAKTLMARGEWDFRVLLGIRTSPTLSHSGRTIQVPGYDSGTGLYLDFKPDNFPPVPENPTQEQAVAALHRFSDLSTGILRGFPFDSEASKAVALSAFLTALVRPSMATAPLHGFDAPTAGTGKSMLAEMPGLLASGLKPPAMAQGKTTEESEKRMGAVLIAGDPVILLDNCDLPLEGDLLCSVLTQTQVQVRILGHSEMSVLPSTALIIATGNNLTFQGDVSRRALVCRLDARQERPDSRKFDFDAQQELLADRPALLVGLLTALKAYKDEERRFGRPPIKLTPMGSFADFDWIRGTLIWCGFADPADTRAPLLESDPRKAELAEVMALWSAAFGDRFVSVGDIGSTMGADGLRLALGQATTRNGGWNSKSVGWWLRRHKDRVVAGQAFQRDADGIKWRLAGLLS